MIPFICTYNNGNYQVTSRQASSFCTWGTTLQVFLCSGASPLEMEENIFSSAVPQPLRACGHRLTWPLLTANVGGFLRGDGCLWCLPPFGRCSLPFTWVNVGAWCQRCGDVCFRKGRGGASRESGRAFCCQAPNSVDVTS